MSDEPLELALRALGQKERSVAELGSWLRERGVGDGEAEGLVDHLVAAGMLDDARFARRYVEDKRELAGWGSDRIRAALIERGISSPDIDNALADADPQGELERAVGVLRARNARLADQRDRHRALGLLMRRGYPSEVAYEAIRRAA